MITEGLLSGFTLGVGRCIGGLGFGSWHRNIPGRQGSGVGIETKAVYLRVLAQKYVPWQLVERYRRLRVGSWYKNRPG